MMQFCFHLQAHIGSE